MESINISKLCELLKNSLPNKKFKVIGEVSQPKVSQGHLYFTLKDNITSIKAIIWKTKYEKLKDKIVEGDKVTISGKLDYYGFTGTISFIVDSILENEGIGELQKEYELLKDSYLQKGYFDKKNKLPMPNVIKKILILTSSNGAAIHDFLFNLENNNAKIDYTVIDVPVQGFDSPKIIANKLDELNDMELDYDLIVITRGGGSFQDLFGFSDKYIIESVYNFKKIPILSAIGHQIDNPLLDLVADYSCPTPSLAAQFIVDTNKKYIMGYYDIKDQIKNEIVTNIFNKQKELNILNNKLKNSFNEIHNIIYKFNNEIISELNNKKIKLEYMKKNLDDPSIKLFDTENNKIESPDVILKDNIYILRWNNQDLQIKFI
jgi:exodeoxyribonuclease VII large subunit